MDQKQRNRDAQLTREMVRLRRQLERANAIIDAQKKTMYLGTLVERSMAILPR